MAINAEYWGSTLAAGHRRIDFSARVREPEMGAIIAAQRLVESFRALNKIQIA
jgi:hypothetical protein